MQTNLAQKLRDCIERGMSQAEIAEKTGVHQTTISRILAGAGCRMDTYLRLAEFLKEHGETAA